MEKKFAIILLSGGNGRRYSLRMSGAAVTVLAVGLACLLSFFFLSTAACVLSAHENRTSAKLAAELKVHLTQLKAEKEESAGYRAWSENIIRRHLNFEEVSGMGTDMIADNVPDGPVNSPGSPTLMDIEHFDVNRVNLSLDFNCTMNLINRFNPGRKLSGYFFIIARNDEVIPSIYSTWPPAPLNSDGMPADYARGAAFSIRHMKKITGRINQRDIGPKFNRVDLLAYSESGELLMKRGFYIQKLLQQSPFE